MGKKSSSKDAGSPKGGKIAAKMRGMVSMNKVRFQEEGFDLDLTYITPRVIAMGFPSFGAEAYYRNPVDKVELFFNTRHKGKYRIYNLCSERKYDKDDRFDRNYKRFPFDDHNAPAPISIITEFVRDVQNFLDKDPENVVAIHCKAGKGRTGVLVATYLMASEAKYRQPQQALSRFAELRTNDGHGVTIPSQHRYVRYYDRMLNEYKGLPPPTIPVKLESITVKGGSSQWDLYITVLEGPDRMGSDQSTLYDSRNHIPSKQASRGSGAYQFDLRSKDVVLRGDVKVIFYAAHRIKKNEHLFHYWFHSSFIEPTTHTLKKEFLDKAAKDTKHQQFKPELTVSFSIGEHREEGRMKRADSTYYTDTAKETAAVENVKPEVSDSSSNCSSTDDEEEDSPAAETPKPAAESPPASPDQLSAPPASPEQQSPPQSAVSEEPTSPASPPETDSERSLREMRERMAARAREREIEKEKREEERKNQAAAREERLKAEAEKRQREREESKKKREKERQERLQSLSPRLKRTTEPTSPSNISSATVGSPTAVESDFPQSPTTPIVDEPSAETTNDESEVIQQSEVENNETRDREREEARREMEQRKREEMERLAATQAAAELQQQEEDKAKSPSPVSVPQSPSPVSVPQSPSPLSVPLPQVVPPPTINSTTDDSDVIGLAIGIINRVKAIEESCAAAMKRRGGLEHVKRNTDNSNNCKDSVSVIALSLLQRSARLEIVCLQESEHRKLKSLYRIPV